MHLVNIHDAKTHLSKYLTEVEHGHEMIIARAGKPVAKLVPFRSNKSHTMRIGGYRGKLKIAEDFDAPLPDDILKSFEGG